MWFSVLGRISRRQRLSCWIPWYLVCICVIYLRPVSVLILVFIYRPHLSHCFWYSLLSLISPPHYWYSDVRLIFQIHFDVKFSVSFRSLVSDSGSQWLTLKQFFWAHTAAFAKHCRTRISVRIISRQTLQHGQFGNVRPGLSLWMQLFGSSYRTHNSTRRPAHTSAHVIILVYVVVKCTSITSRMRVLTAKMLSILAVYPHFGTPKDCQYWYWQWYSGLLRVPAVHAVRKCEILGSTVPQHRTPKCCAFLWHGYRTKTYCQYYQHLQCPQYRTTGCKTLPTRAVFSVLNPELLEVHVVSTVQNPNALSKPETLPTLAVPPVPAESTLLSSPLLGTSPQQCLFNSLFMPGIPYGTSITSTLYQVYYLIIKAWKESW